MESGFHAEYLLTGHHSQTFPPSAYGMSLKPTRFAAVIASSLFFVALAARSGAQAPPAAAAEVVGPATWNRLFSEAEAAFTAKNYEAAIAKIQELIKALGTNKDAPYELLYFNIGLANLMSDKNAEAEAAFLDCIKRFPGGEYTSRAYLGVGRSAMLQEGPEKKQRALEALRIAARDPRYRSEAGLWLGQVLIELGKLDEAMVVFRSLMGSDVRTPQQTNAAVEVIGLLADTGRVEDLYAYLDNLSSQSGVRNSLAWFANQVVVRGDDLRGNQGFEAALAIYRSVPPRSEIIAIQSSALESMRKERKALEASVAAEQNRAINQRSRASEVLNNLKPAIEQAEAALKAIEEKTDFDAALLMRRGRCLFNLNRLEEALLCFRTIRTKYEASADAQFAAYAEIVALNKLRNLPEIKDKCELFLRKYPEAENAEQVASLAGEVLVQGGDWKEVGAFYRNLEARFPQSESLERFVFFQALAYFQEASFSESTPLFERFLKTFPDSPLAEKAFYFVAMSKFLSNKYQETLAACGEYLKKFPDGMYAGDMHYRLSFIDFNDKGPDDGKDDKKAQEYRKKMSAKIVRELNAFLKDHPDDAANGSMLCLIADSHKREDQTDEAIEAYKKAVMTDSPDDVIQYALDSATPMLQAKKDWAGIAALHGDFLKRRPQSQLALISAAWIARAKAYEGKSAEASAMLADSLMARIADPSSEQVEFLIDELVKTLVPRKKASEIDTEAVDKQLQEILGRIVAGRENPTTAARIYYARARLAQMLKRNDLSNLYLKGIATGNAKNPAALSPQLLAASGDILLKIGDLEGAEAMYKRLADRYAESIFADAGPVGLGYVALARKKPEEALKIFDDTLENNRGMSRFKETTLGKLQALVELDKFEAAEKLALQVVGDKNFKGESTGKAYLLLGDAYRKMAAKSDAVTPAVAKDQRAKAHAYYQRVYVTFKAFPDICAKAMWEAAAVAKEMGNEELYQSTLKALREDPKLKNTEYWKKAQELGK